MSEDRVCKTVLDPSSCNGSLLHRAMPGALIALLAVTIFPWHRAFCQDEVFQDASVTETKYFITSGRCALCHSSAPGANALKDEKGRSVAPSDLWPTSMMANSTVDPLWRAVVASEVAATPSRKKEIEAKCLKCHAPMASIEAEIAGHVPTREEFLHGDTTYSKLAADGVSCTVCHQIPPEGLGEDKTFSGHFTIGRKGKIFGPHHQPFSMPMYAHTGYMPTESDHVRKSAMCASCHTLFTDSLNADGSPTGHMLLEQGPYVEWQNSDFNTEVSSPSERAASCQDCHVPTTDLDGKPIKTRIARNPHGFDFPPVRPRDPFGRHTFIGANTLMLTILRDSLTGSDSTAKAAGFDSAISETRKMLRERTAQIEISSINNNASSLAVVVAVTNLSGHKLPTAYPSRRVWIRLEVSDQNGDRFFVSGDFDDRGRIVDRKGEVLRSEAAGGPSVPHYKIVDSSEEVQIYEAVMQDKDGNATYSLLRGAQYQKDNRLLPTGWKKDHKRGESTAPAGTASDNDFRAGTDEVLYKIDTTGRKGPFQIQATMHYQTLGSRYAAELFQNDVQEMSEFRRLYESAQPVPELVARDSKSTDQ